MDLSIIFIIANGLALFGWAFLIFARNSLIAQGLVRNLALPVVLAIAYSGLLINEIAFGAASGNGGFTSLTKVMGMFEAPNGALMAWTHFLVFDLFVGAWMVEMAERANVSSMRLAPALVLTMLFGPVGFLYYLVAIPRPQAKQA